MTESARPESVVPAPSQGFRQWVRRQALIGVAITVGVIGFFVVRMLLREVHPLRDFDGWRVWVTGAPTQGAYGRPDAVALVPGGPRLDADATVVPTFVRWGQDGTNTMWPCVQLSVDDSRRLVRGGRATIGSFALLGEKRIVGGVEWQEAWRWIDVGSGYLVPDRHRPDSIPGTWRIDGASDTPATLRLERSGKAHGVVDAPSDSSAPSEPWEGMWFSNDGVIQIVDPSPSTARVRMRTSSLVLGRLAADGRSFTGSETSGAAVTGTRIE